MFLADTGLFVTLAFWGKEFTENIIYQKLWADKLNTNLGYIFENVVLPLVERVCRELTNEREREIMRLALHETQKKNELLSYEHASASALEMLRKQSNYMYCPLYRKIIEQIKAKIS